MWQRGTGAWAGDHRVFTLVGGAIVDCPPRNSRQIRATYTSKQLRRSRRRAAFVRHQQDALPFRARKWSKAPRELAIGSRLKASGRLLG